MISSPLEFSVGMRPDSYIMAEAWPSSVLFSETRVSLMTLTIDNPFQMVAVVHINKEVDWGVTSWNADGSQALWYDTTVDSQD